MPATRPSSKMAPLGQTRRDFQGYHFFDISKKKALLKRLKKSTEKLSCYSFTRLERKRSYALDAIFSRPPCRSSERHDERENRREGHQDGAGWGAVERCFTVSGPFEQRKVGNFEGHGFVGWGRKSRPAVVLSSRIFSAVCTRIGSRVFHGKSEKGKKRVGPVPFPGLGRVDTPGGTVVVSSARAETLPADSRCSGPLQERVENAWSPRGRAFVPGKNPTGPEPTLGDLPGPSCRDGDCGGAY